jgi:hypothetical protein
MSFFKKVMDFSVDRVRSFSVFDMALFKLTMFFLGVLFAANIPHFSKRGKGLIAVVTAIMTGTFLGYFFFGERYFELDHDGETVTVKKGA